MAGQSQPGAGPHADETPRRLRPLFVGGPARSGTTAFADYLNRHEEVLLCEERYKGIQDQVSWDLFSFERIMDFSRPKETERPPLAQTREEFVKRHAELLAGKDRSKLRWLGDKGPFYVRSMEQLAANNPGARFIMLYRPIEEVAESWESRARDPGDPWRGERGIERSVRVWNASMRGMRRFAKASPAPRLLIVGYHDFFHRNDGVVPQLSRFLGLNFDNSLTGAWREASGEFEGRRRSKGSLSGEQKSFIQGHADREAEAWVLDRIERQWREPALYAEENDEAALAALDEIEAKMWRLLRVNSEARREAANERKRNRDLKRQLEAIQSSRTWGAMRLLGRIKRRMSGKG